MTTNASAFFTIALVTAMPVLLLWQTFVFFFKTYQISKYTSANQRFWKRAIFALWALEFFFFIILIYLWFNAPAHMLWSFANGFAIRKALMGDIYLFESIFIPTTMLVLCNTMLFLNKTHGKLIKIVMHGAMFVILSYLLLFEFLQLLGIFIRTVQYLPSYSQTDSVKVTTEYLSLVDFRKEDTNLNQMRMLMIFLKFWHILFIYGYLFFITIRFVEYKNLSFDTYSSLYVNFMALAYFNLLFILFKCRKLLYFYWKLPPRCMIMQEPLNILQSLFDLVIYAFCYY